MVKLERNYRILHALATVAPSPTDFAPVHNSAVGNLTIAAKKADCLLLAFRWQGYVPAGAMRSHRAVTGGIPARIDGRFRRFSARVLSSAVAA